MATRRLRLRRHPVGLAIFILWGFTQRCNLREASLGLCERVFGFFGFHVFFFSWRSTEVCELVLCSLLITVCRIIAAVLWYGGYKRS